MAAMAMAATAAHGQGFDPRTAAGQLAVCGGYAAWQAVGYLEFSVRTEVPAGSEGPWIYHWDRRNNYARIIGPGSDGVPLDLALDLGSRSGGGSRDGKPLLGPDVASAVSWAFGRLGEDLLWLTFPLEWDAPGVTLTPGPDTTGPAGNVRTVRVSTRAGDWDVWLDAASGRIVRTQSPGAGGGRLTVWWSGWKSAGGILFASERREDETKRTVQVTVSRALPTAPADAF